MAKKAKSKKKTTKKVKPKYKCVDCGTVVTVDCCGVGFTNLVCCGEVMKKKAKKKK